MERCAAIVEPGRECVITVSHQVRDGWDLAPVVFSELGWLVMLLLVFSLLSPWVAAPWWRARR